MMNAWGSRESLPQTFPFVDARGRWNADGFAIEMRHFASFSPPLSGWATAERLEILWLQSANPYFLSYFEYCEETSKATHERTDLIQGLVVSEADPMTIIVRNRAAGRKAWHCGSWERASCSMTRKQKRNTGSDPSILQSQCSPPSDAPPSKRSRLIVPPHCPIN